MESGIAVGLAWAGKGWRCVMAAGLLMLGWASGAAAAERAFTFTYETTTMPAGTFEIEQWATWSTHKKEDKAFDALDFREELEFGLTDRLQLGIYAADWGYQDGASVKHDGVKYQDSGVEAIYSLTSPVTDPVGVALYGEFLGGPELLKLEAKLLLQKNIGPFIIAWNGILEAEWEEEHYVEDNGVLGQTLGLSYQVMPSLTVGAEAVHEIKIEDWEGWGEHVFYMGPNASYRAKGWWVTVTPLIQVTDVDGEADFVGRLIFGINF